MKTQFTLVLALAIGTLSLSSTTAQEAIEEHGPPSLVLQLSEQHKLLAEDVGSWEAEMKVWMNGPDEEPMVTTATETNYLIGGGAWLVSDFECQFGDDKFTGHGQFGYDPVKGKYVGTWIDSANVHMSQMEGTFDAATKTMKMTSKGYDPHSGAEMTSKMTTKYNDDGTRVMEMYVPNPATGEYFRNMMLTYTKKS